jgi:hypothetical protein
MKTRKPLSVGPEWGLDEIGKKRLFTLPLAALLCYFTLSVGAVGTQTGQVVPRGLYPTPNGRCAERRTCT